jgi:hypothetical protein
VGVGVAASGEAEAAAGREGECEVVEGEDAAAEVGEEADDESPRGRRVESKDEVRVDEGTGSTKEGGEAAGSWWAKEWDEVRTHRGALRLLTMMAQSTDGVVSCQAALGPCWAGGIYIREYINAREHQRTRTRERARREASGR